MICFAGVCSAQEHTAQIAEALPNDQFIVVIGGRDYIAVNRAKAQELMDQKVDLETCKANSVRQNQIIELAGRDTIIAQQQAAIEHGNFLHAMSMFETERSLRQEAQSQFIPHGKVGGFGGKLFNFLDGPYGASLFKLVLPTATFIKTMRSN